ncbi:DUF3472 domain-containing protein [Lacimicrobium alkaliphilum]|uniref:DUF5077 domain-containing protein n=1 Tax=Lacimicrobium alkaliphilum TaxID=1526571 RepID=A0A0U3AX56_9ALTE|nr:DUF3472 domain-containing protein [Lacimicrobium alkaliphilum]ALS98687.1 hypothetical protein AT746_10675 [Lacimicrobium alkaliphilum]
MKLNSLKRKTPLIALLLLLVGINLSACNGSGNPDTDQPLAQKPEPVSELPDGQPYTLPIGTNSWVENNPQITEQLMSESGIRDWKRAEHQPVIYFATDQAMDITLGLRGKIAAESAQLRVQIGEQQHQLSIDNHANDDIPAGKFSLEEPGYHAIRLSRTSDGEAIDLDQLLIWPDSADPGLTYLTDNSYWGRRGPSVHFSYEMSANRDIQWFYSQLQVPVGEDVPGSYYMANGFAEGYFGIQVNSDIERRVLFSVWSPYQTDNPEDIPPELRIELLRKGDGVYTGEFGNEGSGGQSYLKYNWQSDKTYEFLLQVQPDGETHTDYSAWFKPDDEQQWQLIASFRRPDTQTWASRLHSFLENFLTQYGDRHRSAWYSNQWARDTQGNWHELTRATLTADATARDGDRLDYNGEANERGFLLENGGFIYPPAELDTAHERTALGQPPEIDFDTLP